MQTELATSRLAECEYIIERGLNTFVEVGAALLEIREGKLYRHHEGYDTFEEYCQKRWGIERRRAYQLMDAAEVVENVKNFSHFPVRESHVAPLAGLPPETQIQVWQQVVDTAPNGKITGEFVQQVVDRVTRPENIHVSDDSYEWYTPAEYIEAARRVMGGIDLDPATCKEANEVVKAEYIYTQDDDGLSCEWFGRVWLNPPYNMPNIENFTAQAHDLYRSKYIEQAVVLVNNATDAAWFHALMENYPVCFTRGRVKYWGPNASQARQGQAIFYLGDNIQVFKKEFSKFGLVMHLL
jgi:phage N-6-adenine-methyltransferase